MVSLSFIDKIRKARNTPESNTSAQLRIIEEAKKIHAMQDGTPPPAHPTAPAYVAKPIAELHADWQKEIAAVAKTSRDDLIAYGMNKEASTSGEKQIAQQARNAVEKRFESAFAKELVAAAKAYNTAIFAKATAHLHDEKAIQAYVLGLLDDHTPEPMPARAREATLLLSDIVNGIWTDATTFRMSGTKDTNFPDIHHIIEALTTEAMAQNQTTTGWRKALISKHDIDPDAAPSR